MAINPHLYGRLGYDPLKDFVPIARVGVGPLLLAVNSALPVTSVAQLVALAKETPGRLTFGSFRRSSSTPSDDRHAPS